MQLSTERQDRLIRWLTAAGIYYICLIAFYIDIGQDMGAEYFIPVFLPVMLALVLVQYGTRVPLFSWATLPNLFTGLAWCSAFPLLYTWTYHQDWYMSKICFDFLVGTSLFLLLTALEGALFRLGHEKLIAALMALLNLFGIVIPFIQYAYYFIVWHCLSPASLMALYLTNWRESIDFIESNVGVIPACIIIAGLGLFLYACWRGHMAFARRLEQEDSTAGRMGALALLVIGESASRNYMKAFTKNYAYDDTPWQSQQENSPDFLFFQNAYSSWSQTVPVLQRALTEQSQYNGKEFFNSASILDVAKKSGYDTYWFSNQGRYGQYDSAITLVAKTADHAEWTDDSYNFSDKYDETLLPYLMQVDPNKNNFIVLHIMGSHIYYNNRYPEGFNKFQGEEGSSTMTSEASYANSILYTDYILSQVFDYAKKNLNLQAMVYFSDHGENLTISHNPDVFSFDMVRIPMWIYLSPSYQAALPGRTATLRSHESRYFTNDMLYDTVCGLLNAPSEHYDPGQDFTSTAYRFNRDNLTTMLGQYKLSADPDGTPEQ